MAKFKKITREQAWQLGRGNEDGYADYTWALNARYDETDTHLDPYYLRGYLRGYWLASHGKPMPTY